MKSQEGRRPREAPPAESPRDTDRVARLLRILIRATHALQATAENERAAESLVVEQFLRATKRPLRDWLDWATHARNEFDGLLTRLESLPEPGPATPAPLLCAWLRQRAPSAPLSSIASTANLVQLALSVNHDGGLLQDLFRIYIGLNLDPGLAQHGISVEDEALLDYGEELSLRSSPGPLDSSPVAWQVALKKVQLWSEQHSGRCTKDTLADELLQTSDLLLLLPSLHALEPVRAGFLGHSMTMSLHWTTHASWCDIAGEVRKRIQPEFEYAGFHAGGLTPSRALHGGLFDRMLSWHPNEVYLLVLVRSQADRDSLAAMVTELKRQRCPFHLVDDVRPWAYEIGPEQREAHEFQRALCAREGGVFLDFQRRHVRAADCETWRPIGGDIHMYTPGHLFYAKELLAYWSRHGRRKPSLPN